MQLLLSLLCSSSKNSKSSSSARLRPGLRQLFHEGQFHRGSCPMRGLFFVIFFSKSEDMLVIVDVDQVFTSM